MKMEKFAYIGCRTTKERKARGKGISVYKVDGDNWELVQILEGQVNPSWSFTAYLYNIFLTSSCINGNSKTESTMSTKE